MTRALIQKPQETCHVHEAKLEQAREIAEMFEAALGAGGVLAAGHDPYPDPDLFSEAGIANIINAPERQLIVATYAGRVAGGMVIDWLNEYQCEFNCLAVRGSHRKLKIGSAILRSANRFVDARPLVLNTTEFVTHSLGSQSSYLRDDLNRICGFSYCHYPQVFFPDHPESVLWVSTIQGHLKDEWRRLRRVLGPRATSARIANVLSRSQYADAMLREPVASIAKELLRARPIYVPTQYKLLARKILSQFDDVLDYDVRNGEAGSDLSADSDRLDYPDGSSSSLHIDWKGSYRYCHLVFPPGFDMNGNTGAVDRALEQMKERGKKFIFARICINDPGAHTTAEYLRHHGFVFHSILPLYQLNLEGNTPRFSDVLGMQWIDPLTAQRNELPGETNSVIKIYGYPANVSGPIIETIKQELYGG